MAIAYLGELPASAAAPEGVVLARPMSGTESLSSIAAGAGLLVAQSRVD